MKKEYVTVNGNSTEEARDMLEKDFPAEALSPIPGGANLTSINASWCTERLNKVFGLCGYGWRYIICSNDMPMPGQVIACVSLAYKLVDVETGETHWSEAVPQFGGGVQRGKGPLGDAYKSAVTDALTKAASLVGLGLNTFKGEVTHLNAKPAPLPEPEKPKAINGMKEAYNAWQEWFPGDMEGFNNLAESLDISRDNQSERVDEIGKLCDRVLSLIDTASEIKEAVEKAGL